MMKDLDANGDIVKVFFRNRVVKVALCIAHYSRQKALIMIEEAYLVFRNYFLVSMFERRQPAIDVTMKENINVVNAVQVLLGNDGGGISKPKRLVKADFLFNKATMDSD